MDTLKFTADVLRRLKLNNDKLTDNDFAELTAELIEASATQSGTPVELDDGDHANLRRIYGPRRDLQRDRLGAIMEKHGITPDHETDGTIELMLNPGVFVHQMTEITDGDGKPLVVKNVKVKKKDRIKAL